MSRAEIEHVDSSACEINDTVQLPTEQERSSACLRCYPRKYFLDDCTCYIFEFPLESYSKVLLFV